MKVGVLCGLSSITKIGVRWTAQRKTGVPMASISVRTPPSLVLMRFYACLFSVWHAAAVGPTVRAQKGRGRSNCGRGTGLAAEVAMKMIKLQAEFHGKISYRHLAGEIQEAGPLRTPLRSNKAKLQPRTHPVQPPGHFRCFPCHRGRFLWPNPPK